jgi:hypothetical protein
MPKEQVAAIGTPATPGVIGPADGAAVAAHRVRLLEHNEVDWLGLIRERRDVERVLGT